MLRPISLLADLVRLPIALLIWNGRKTVYRIRGARGRCPCQHPSDSGKAGESGCDACVSWNAPVRFRWVCPLLVRDEQGWRCSVRAEEVRPFWGRAALIFLTGLLSAHLIVTCAVLTAFRATGVDRLRWIDVAWPGRWEQISIARARSFTVRAAQLLQQTDFVGAELSLQSALQLDPANYEASLFLAHLKQYQQDYPYSDYLFRRLLDKFPDRTSQTAIAWHDALLVRQRYPELAELSLHMAEMPSELRPSWVRSALFAVRLGQSAPDFVRRNAGRLAALPRAAAALFFAEDLIQRERSPAAVKLLLESGTGALSPVLVFEYVEQLLRLKEPGRAEAFVRRYASTLTAFDRAFAQMRIDQASEDAALLRLDYEALLRFPITPATFDRLAAWLVEHPDRRSFDRLARIMERPANQSAIIGAEMWVAAMACGAGDEAAAWARFCVTHLGLRVPAITSLDFAKVSMTNPASIPRIIAIGRLPREVVFGLLQRSATEKRAAAESVAGRADAPPKSNDD